MDIAVIEGVDGSALTLKGRVAVVTGSITGMGLGIARALARAGAQIVLNGLGQTRDVIATQDQIESEFGVRTCYVAADMSEPAEIADLIEKALREFGRLDILVNNARIQHVARIDEFPIEKWDAILAINLSSAFHTTQLALPVMRRKSFGRIINIASAHGLVGSPFKSAYVSAKHGLVGLTKATALETAEEPITCNAICPGYVYTPRWRRRLRARRRPTTSRAIE
jgi:3-hydroxybutyrate dehydrogenase